MERSGKALSFFSKAFVLLSKSNDQQEIVLLFKGVSVDFGMFEISSPSLDINR